MSWRGVPRRSQTPIAADGSSAVIGNDTDALAYALVRMPATYAAVTACLDALQIARPDFTPANMIDLGAGPGTATFAAADAFPSLARFALTDTNESSARAGAYLDARQ